MMRMNLSNSRRHESVEQRKRAWKSRLIEFLEACLIRFPDWKKVSLDRPGQRSTETDSESLPAKHARFASRKCRRAD
jgi:hypothetical protein